MKSRRLLTTEKTLIHYLQFEYSVQPILNTNSQLIYITNFTYILTPWSRAVREKLTGYHVVKKLLIFYGTRRFHSG